MSHVVTIESGLKILIQDRRTGCYWGAQGTWEQEPALAQDFVNTTVASQLCRENKLRDVQITLKFGNGNPDIVLPVG